MLKTKFLRCGLAMFLFGTFGLFSCSQNASVSTNVNPTELTGSVEVTLPDLSNGALAKSALLLDANSLNLFITGANMDTIKYSWPMYSLKGQRVQINGIPAGANRNFSGFLTEKSGIITHTGKVVATITAGVVVPVHLKLSATGSVDLCIEIEGYPSSCNGSDTVIINSCAKISGYKMVDGTISFLNSDYYVTGSIGFTDTIWKTFTFEKLYTKKDSAGTMYFEIAGFCKETGISARYELFIKGNTVSIGYIYNMATKQLIYKFYSVECTQQDTTILHGKLNAYIQTSPQDTLVAGICIRMIDGFADGYLELFNYTDTSTLRLDMIGTGKVYPDQRYGYFTVSTQDSSGCTYTLGMSFNQNGESVYCKGSLDRKGTSCSSGPVAIIYGNLQ